MTTFIPIVPIVDYAPYCKEANRILIYQDMDYLRDLLQIHLRQKMTKANYYAVKIWLKSIRLHRAPTRKRLGGRSVIDYCLITVNPDTTKITLSQFTKLIDKVAHSAMFSECKYAFEQRGESPDDLGKGFHVHMLVKNKVKPSQIRRNLKRIFLKPGYCGHPKHIDVKQVKEGTLSQVEDYLNGLKGDGKEAKVCMDSPWRLQNGLKALYCV